MSMVNFNEIEDWLFGQSFCSDKVDKGKSVEHKLKNRKTKTTNWGGELKNICG